MNKAQAQSALTTLGTVFDQLADDVDQLRFNEPVAYVYNPLRYARSVFDRYLDLYARPGTKPRALLLGMNPGPWGMAQTGIPFGVVSLVREWFDFADVPVGRPELEHPKRPVEGMNCSRDEVSGQRVWSWAQDRFVTPDRFFDRFFVLNYCPLLFLAESGRNLTPDKLTAGERAALTEVCDRALAQVIEVLQPTELLGVGVYAEACLQRVASIQDLRIGRILHPSPASPAANRGWREAAERQLTEFGIQLPSK